MTVKPLSKCLEKYKSTTVKASSKNCGQDVSSEIPILEWVQAEILLADRYCQQARLLSLAGNFDQADELRDKASAIYERAEKIAAKHSK